MYKLLCIYSVPTICKDAMDVTIILDGNGKKKFPEERTFVNSVATALDIPEGPEDEEGGSSELTVIPFGVNPDIAKFKPEERYSVKNLGTPPTLDRALEKYKDEQYNREEKFNVSKALILVIDCNRPVTARTKEIVKDMRTANQIVTVLCIGKDTVKSAFENGIPDHVEVVPTREEITDPKLVAKLVNESCVHGK